jgi:DNA mismatch repair protein MutL
MRRIRVLPDHVANQIAAGEVVERPASVVKELVENSLDARAGRVDVAVEAGGKRRIRVSDDGVGMGREDALLALDRHATSKIETAADLVGVRTLGFRGEALPSIAAVSRMSLETREANDQVGTAVRITGGTITKVEDVARQPGTTVDVAGLFFNAPARAKFLKSARVETRAVSDVVTTLALAHPVVAFTLASDSRTLLDLPAARDLPARIMQLWGLEAASTLLPVSGSGHGLEVRGLVQRPDAAQPGMRRAHLFMEGRPFRDRALLKAADRGYRTTIPAGHRPWLFLYLRAPAGSVDVNVHPAKAEVRFRHAAEVEGLVEGAVRQALDREESSATFDTQLAPPSSVVREPSPGSHTDEAPGEGQMALFLAGVDEEAPVADMTPELGASEQPRLWQIHNTYILAETRNGLLIIDQHSAHERVLFQRLMDAFALGGQTGQRLLFPITLRLGQAEYGQVETLAGLFSRAGFEVEGFGGDTIIVQAVPNPHPYFDAERCLREMVEELTHGSELVRSAGNQHERIAMTFACKGAIKAGQKLALEEMQELFDSLFATELPYHDVHGRPTIVRLTKAELERKFGR